MPFKTLTKSKSMETNDSLKRKRVKNKINIIKSIMMKYNNQNTLKFSIRIDRGTFLKWKYKIYNSRRQSTKELIIDMESS